MRLKLYFMASVACLALATSQNVMAQDASAKPDVKAAKDEVVVTGTRIRKPNIKSAAPIVTLDKKELEYEGVMNIEEALNRLPQARYDNTQFGAGFDNGGQAKVNLRNLGNQRTLVLMDGERLLPVQAIDLNIIPPALIQRVDVLTGGASSTYGSDAVAGVVNFIMKKNYEGVQLNSNYSFYQDTNNDQAVRSMIGKYPNFPLPPEHVTDGARADFSLAAGRNFDGGKGNVSVFVEYRNQEPVKWGSRDYSACRINGSLTSESCSANSTYTPFGQIFANTGPSAGQSFYINKDGSQSFDSSSNSANYLSNTRKDWNFIRGDKRVTGGLFLNYAVNDHAEIYFNGLIMRDVSIEQQSGASGTGQYGAGGASATIHCNNPYMSASQAQTLCGANAGTSSTVSIDYAVLEQDQGSTPVESQIVNADYRMNGGIKGAIVNGWHYDVNLVTSRVEQTLSDDNEFDAVKLNNAIDAVGVNGNVSCFSGAPGCVPMNIFQSGKVNPAVFPYIYDNLKWTNVVQQQDVTANINGDLTQYGIKSPWADDGVGIAFGSEYRRDSLAVYADQATIDYEGWFSTTGGHYAVKEAYAEAQIPLVNDQPFAKKLSMNLGLRYSKYDNQPKSLPTNKVELLYYPVDDLLLRTSYNEAARAPNISELYSPGGFVNFSGLQDQCSKSNYTAAKLQQCLNTGATQAELAGGVSTIPDCTGSCRTQGGGNPLLVPETAISRTMGFVYTPSQLKGFLLSIDYVDIKLNNYIGYIDPAGSAYPNCMSTGLEYYCRFIHRDPTTGALFGTSTTSGYVAGGTENTNLLRYKGIDIQTDYNFSIGAYGKIDVNMQGTLVGTTGGQDTPLVPFQNCAGYFGYGACWTPQPRWRQNTRLTWNTPWDHASLSMNWRYIGGTALSANSTVPALNGYSGPAGYTYLNKLPQYSYIDLSGSFVPVKNLKAQISINNLFDVRPPIVPSTWVDGTTNNPNTYAGMYDSLGRAIIASLQYNF